MPSEARQLLEFFKSSSICQAKLRTLWMQDGQAAFGCQATDLQDKFSLKGFKFLGQTIIVLMMEWSVESTTRNSPLPISTQPSPRGFEETMKVL